MKTDKFAVRESRGCMGIVAIIVAVVVIIFTGVNAMAQGGKFHLSTDTTLTRSSIVWGTMHDSGHCWSVIITSDRRAVATKDCKSKKWAVSDAPAAIEMLIYMDSVHRVSDQKRYDELMERALRIQKQRDELLEEKKSDYDKMDSKREPNPIRKS